MKKYLIISVILHLCLFLGFRNLKKVGDENFNKVVPVTFVVAKTTSPNPGSPVVADKEPKKVEEKKTKQEVKKEKVVEKKEIKSKVAKKDAKKEEKVVQQAEAPKEIVEVAQEESKETKGNLDAAGDGVFQGSNFLSDGDGGYIALSSQGINYEIIREVEPDYPSQAEAIGYSQKVVVTVKFLVGHSGSVEKYEIIKSHSKLGFDDEVKKAIKSWKFKPIYYHGKNIKVYFVKDFIFTPR